MCCLEFLFPGPPSKRVPLPEEPFDSPNKPSSAGTCTRWGWLFLHLGSFVNGLSMNDTSRDALQIKSRPGCKLRGLFVAFRLLNLFGGFIDRWH